MIARREPALVASLFFTALLSCRGAVHEPQVVRLVDLFPSAVVSGSVSAPSEIPPTEWRFDAGGDLGWKAGVGVTGLRVREGRLAGTTTADFPIIHVERTSGLDEPSRPGTRLRRRYRARHDSLVEPAVEELGTGPRPHRNEAPSVETATSRPVLLRTCTRPAGGGPRRLSSRGPEGDGAEALRRRFARFKHRRRFHFLEEMPKGALGKVQKAVLRRLIGGRA